MESKPTPEQIAETTEKVLSGILNIAQQKIEDYLHNNGFKGYNAILELKVTQNNEEK